MPEAVILGDGSHRSVETVRLLLGAGADPHLPDRDGVTPAVHAERRGPPALADPLRTAEERACSATPSVPIRHAPLEEERMTESPRPSATDHELTVSRRQALAVGGGLAAAAVGSVAAADPAAAQTGAAGPQRLLSLSLEQAKAVVAAAEREARGIRVPSFIVVVDACGDVKASSRQDGNSRASLVLAPLKAQTALAFRTATATLAQRTTDPVRAQSLLAAGFTLLGGGVPLTAAGQVIGALGVGGGSPEQDIQVAEAGAAALRP